MLVYRVCKEDEIKKILDEKSFKNVGSKYKIIRKISTHKYDQDKKYLHFFHDYDSLFYLATSEKHYICTYDIPELILKQFEGLGYYYDRIYLEKLESVDEFAIPIEKIDFSYLKKVDKIRKNINFEDYVLGNYIDNLQTIYNKNSMKTKIKTIFKK